MNPIKQIQDRWKIKLMHSEHLCIKSKNYTIWKLSNTYTSKFLSELGRAIQNTYTARIASNYNENRK